MAIDTRAKRQAAATVPRPWAPSVLPTGVNTSFTRAAGAGGYFLATGQTIVPNAFQNTRIFGSPTLTQVGSQGPYTFFIAGTDRSTFVDLSIQASIHSQINSRSTASFSTRDVSGGGWTPTEGDDVSIYEGSTLRFKGSVTRTVEQRLMKTAYPRVQVTCGDLGVKIANRAVNAFYSIDLYGAPYYIVLDLIAKHAADLGLIYVPRPALADLFPIPDQLFYGLNLGECFNALAKLMNCDWNIDQFNNFYFIGLSDAQVNGNSFSDSSGNWLEVTATRTVALEGNRIFAKSSAQLLQTQTDTFPGNSFGIYVMTYPPRDPNLLPIVKVNGVTKVVVTSDDAAGGATYDFYRVGTVVSQNYSHTPLSSSDTVTVTYPSPIPYIGIAEDAADILANGLKEVILECGNITSKATLDAIAAAWLDRLKERATQITVKTGSKIEAGSLTPSQRNWLPGQKVSVNLTAGSGAPPLVDDFLIDSTDLQIRDDSVTFQTLVMSNSQYQRTSNPAKFMADLIARLRTIALTPTQVLTLSSDTDLGVGFVLGVDQQINLDSSNGPFTVTLPPANEMYGKQISWMKVSDDGNSITLAGATVGGNQQNINGQTTQTISTQYQSAITEGNQWQ